MQKAGSTIMPQIKAIASWVLLSLILVAVALLLTSQTVYLQTVTGRVQASAGRLDLSGWPGKDVVLLGGEWQFYPDQLIAEIDPAKAGAYRTVPDRWRNRQGPDGGSTGVATYRLQVTGLDPSVHYAVNILDEASAYRLLIDGKLILQNGTVADRPEDYAPRWQSQTGYFQANSRGDAQFLLEVANFAYMDGGFWKTVILGTIPVLDAYVDYQKNLEIFLFTFNLVLGLFFLATYNVNRDFLSSLYLSMTCFLLAMRVILRGHRQIYEYIRNLPWDLAVRLEFLAGYLLLPVIFLTVYHLQFTARRKMIDWGANLCSVILIALTLLTPNNVYGKFYSSFVYLVLVSLIYFGYALIQGLRRHRRGAGLLLLSIMVVVPAVLHELLREPDFSFVPFAFLYMLILFSFLVMTNFLEAFKKKSQLETSINLDPLTGLKNRFYLNATLDKGVVVPHSQTLYILFLDLDKFKSINDQHGHIIGDGVLIEASRRIKACFNENDLVCRYGGDEFVVFAWLNSLEGNIQTVVNQIVRQFSEPVVIEGQAYEIGVSIGVSRYQPGENLERIIRQSDHAMYAAKKTTGHGVFYRENTPDA